MPVDAAGRDEHALGSVGSVDTATIMHITPSHIRMEANSQKLFWEFAHLTTAAGARRVAEPPFAPRAGLLAPTGWAVPLRGASSVA